MSGHFVTAFVLFLAIALVTGQESTTSATVKSTENVSSTMSPVVPTAPPATTTTESTFSKIKAFINNVNITATLNEFQKSPLGTLITQTMNNRTAKAEPTNSTSQPDENRITKIWSSLTSTLQNLPSSRLEWSSLLNRNRSSETNPMPINN